MQKILKIISIIFLTTTILGLLSYGGIMMYAVSQPAVVSEPKSKYEVGPPTPQEMLQLINMEREKVGVAPLVLDDNVTKSAQLKAEDMDKRKYYSHNIPNNSGQTYTLTKEMSYWVSLSCSSSGENIMHNTQDGNNSYDTNQAFMGSPPHYKAMVNPKYTKLGVGVAGYKVVQHFCVAK